LSREKSNVIGCDGESGFWSYLNPCVLFQCFDLESTVIAMITVEPEKRAGDGPVLFGLHPKRLDQCVITNLRETDFILVCILRK
jgi:hypothetical protein